ncbi:hypothetical protein ACFFKU_13980 [Kineococcus gynurae]|uniref:Transposase n=1 Tax=Kineococcus gynurae TaxID=452979 RepID=A0ABV5LU41_9ACTN
MSTTIAAPEGGRVYAAFVQDVCTRRIVGWQVAATHLRTELALDALQMAF